MAHSHHMHREHQVSHRRVHKILSGEPDGAKQHNDGLAFSKVTSKSAAEDHDAKVSGHKGMKRYARGGKVKGGKHGHQTNIAIVNPSRPASPTPAPAGPMAGAAPPAAPMGGMPPGMPPGGAPMKPPMAGPPGAPPPGMPMRKHGGRVHKAGGGSMDGESTKADIHKWAKQASKNSFMRGGHVKAGASTGVGRIQEAEKMKRKQK